MTKYRIVPCRDEFVFYVQRQDVYKYTKRVGIWPFKKTVKVKDKSWYTLYDKSGALYARFETKDDARVFIHARIELERRLETHRQIPPEEYP